MLRSILLYAALLAGSMIGVGACIEADANEADPDASFLVCDPGASQPCMCTDGRVGAQVCKTDGSAWDGCVCTAAPDSDTGTDSSGDTDTSCISRDVEVCLALLSACGDQASCKFEFCDCIEEIGCDSASYYICENPDTDTWVDSDSGSDSDADTDVDTDVDSDTDTD